MADQLAARLPVRLCPRGDPILWSSASSATAVRSTNGLPPTTPAAIRRFIATRVSCYGAVTFLNRIAGSKYRAWSPGCQTARYYAKGLLIGDVFSTGSANRVFDRAGIDVPNDETLWNRLAPLKVEWLIVPRASSLILLCSSSLAITRATGSARRTSSRSRPADDQAAMSASRNVSVGARAGGCSGRVTGRLVVVDPPGGLAGVTSSLRTLAAVLMLSAG